MDREFIEAWLSPDAFRDYFGLAVRLIGLLVLAAVWFGLVALMWLAAIAGAIRLLKQAGAI